MITEDDLEGMGYYDKKDDEKYFDSVKAYSDWVETMILTQGAERLVENTLGLVGEAGEVAEKVKKLIRDETKFSDEEVLKELGDVVFYATALSNIYGKGLHEVMELNIEKLNDRLNRGKLKGSGDNR
jgi:NTP pyrophosphatase (non-canonical NTP hydrolase)